MKKHIPLLLLGLLIASCSGGLPNFASLIASPTIPPPTDTPTIEPSVTPLPTYDYFSTATATPVTFTPAPTSLIPDLPTDTPQPPPDFSAQFITELNPNSYFSQSVGFAGILYSNPILYWNSGPCQTRYIDMSVFVEDIINTKDVYMYLRPREKSNTLLVGEWSAGAQMLKAENGSFNYHIRPINIRQYYNFLDAWLEYQFVAVNADREIIGRTPVYERNLTLQMCRIVTSP